MQDPEIANISVIVVSGGVDVERKAETLRPAACLSKPVSRDALLAVVRRRDRARRPARVRRRPS